MLATSSTIESSRNFREQVESRMQEIERLADAGDWENIETVLRRLPGLIARIPDVERRDILLATKERVDRLHARAKEKNAEITEQLATLKIGRRAAASYQATEDGALTA